MIIRDRSPPKKLIRSWKKVYIVKACHIQSLVGLVKNYVEFESTWAPTDLVNVSNGIKIKGSIL